MNLKEFVGRWEFAVYHLSGGKLVLYLEKGDDKVSLVRDGLTIKIWDTVPEVISVGGVIDELTIWPHYPKVTAWTIRGEHLKILNQHAEIPGQRWIRQGASTAIPVIRRG